METVNQDFQTRLNNLSSRLLYLKAESARIQKEKETIDAELLKEGIKTPLELKTTIETREKELGELKVKFEAALVKVEKETLEAEEKLK
jgi:hypothetical protein